MKNSDFTPDFDTIFPATKYNVLYFMRSPNLKGIYYNGDGRGTRLSINGQNPDLSSEVGDSYSISGTTIAANVDFNYKTVFIACTCLAYNKPFATAMLYGAKVQKFLAGFESVASFVGDPYSSNTI